LKQGWSEKRCACAQRELDEVRRIVNKAVERAQEEANRPSWSEVALGGVRDKLAEDHEADREAQHQRMLLIWEETQNRIQCEAAKDELRAGLRPILDRLEAAELDADMVARMNRDLSRIDRLIDNDDAGARGAIFTFRHDAMTFLNRTGGTS
jgi:hypothetical protein